MRIIKAISSFAGWVAGLFRCQKKDDVLLTECDDIGLWYAKLKAREAYMSRIADIHFGEHRDQIARGDG